MKSIYEHISDIQKSVKECVLVTVVDKKGEGPQVVGSKMVVCPDGTTKGTVGGGTIERMAYNKAMELFATKQNGVFQYDLDSEYAGGPVEDTGMICGGTLSLFFEYIHSGIPVYIFGGGHVGRAVINHLRHLDYSITAIDHREGIFDIFENDINAIVGQYSEIIQRIDMTQNSYVIIATPGHAHDYAVLKSILEKPNQPAYIGLMSSKKKLKDVLDMLYKDFGKDIDLNHLYSPVGLDIGGATPDEIAISIIAEMQVIKNMKDGHKHMREQWYL